MARFIGLLLIGPWLVILGLLYWLYARRRAAHGVPAGFDIAVLAVAVVSAVAFSLLAFDAGAAAAARGEIGPVWKQVAAAWVAYPAYFIVLFLGLLSHWIAGRRLARQRRPGAGRGAAP